MNMKSSSTQGQIDGEQDNKGFTLIEILIAIVLVGILSAVAVVGISSLVKKGGDSACGASADASTAASAVYFAANGKYPVTFAELTATAAPGPALTFPTGVTGTGTTAGPGGATPAWTLTMTVVGGTSAPTFRCT